MSKRKKPEIPKIQVQLTKGTLILRLLLMGLALTIAAFAFYNVMSTVFHTESGWQTIQPRNSKTVAGQQFVFQYQIGMSDTSAATEWVRLNKVYSQYLDRACMVFDKAPYDNVSNLYQLNSAPNQPVQVEPELYDALKMLTERGSRYLFLAPVNAQYRSLFNCEDDWQASAFDPAQDGQVMEYVQQVLQFAADENSIRLELGENDTVTLCVSQEYLDFAREEELDSFVDFFYWRNAFVMDCLAEQLVADGYTAGVLTSVEGFSRALGEGMYTVPFFAEPNEEATYVEYPGPWSIVMLRPFPRSNSDLNFYYVKDNGELRTPFVDSATGLSRSDLPSLLLQSDTVGCAELLLSAWDSYIAGTLDVEALPGIQIYRG